MQVKCCDLLHQPEEDLTFSISGESAYFFRSLFYSLFLSFSASCKYRACPGTFCETRCPEWRECLYVCEVSFVLLSAKRSSRPERKYVT